MKERIYKIIILLLLVLLIFSLLFKCGVGTDSDNSNGNNNEEDVIEEDVDDKEEIKEEVGVKGDGTISIPGYEVLKLKANTKKQTISLKNPKENDCYFKIQLMLDDGTILWESDYIEPNKISDNIVLNQELEEGVYKNAVLKYLCFKMDKDYTPLNSAITKLTLQVK